MGKLAIAETNSVSGTTFLHTDALGSPVATTNASGSLLTLTRYEAYGATAAGTNPDGLGFTGHVNDPSTGLVYMQQRYYDPIAARFLSVDPIVTDASSGESFNRYEYVHSNPYRYTDPSGTCTGSNIKNGDGTCRSSGGFTTDTAGTAAGLQQANQSLENQVPVPASGPSQTQTTQAPQGLWDKLNSAFEQLASDLHLLDGWPGNGGFWGQIDAMGPVPIGGIAAEVGAAARGGIKGVTFLYQKVGAAGEHLKFGITNNPATRYTAEELAGGKLRILASGLREDMLALERKLHETLPIGPEERQAFYIKLQESLGLTPPPYQ
jgi:RHS repeat-associated protein